MQCKPVILFFLLLAACCVCCRQKENVVEESTTKKKERNKLYSIDLSYNTSGWIMSGRSFFVDTNCLFFSRDIIYGSDSSFVGPLNGRQFKMLDDLVAAMDTCGIDSVYNGLCGGECYLVKAVIKTKNKTIKTYITGSVDVPLIDSLSNVLYKLSENLQMKPMDSAFVFESDLFSDEFRPF